MTEHYTSFISPNSPIPDPPQFTWIVRAIVATFLIIIGCIILFIGVEFFFDLSGHPLEFGDQPTELELPPPIKPLDPEKEIENILRQSVLLSPGNKVSIKGNQVTYLCTWNDRLGRQIKEPPFPLKLFINEDYVPWTMRYGDNTWLATVELKAGLYQLRTLVHEVEIYVEDGMNKETRESGKKRAKEWKLFKLHERIEQVDKCVDCHFLQESELNTGRKGFSPKIGEWKGSQSCLSCHEETGFQKNHKHDLETFQDCRQCHSVHGTSSEEKALLRGSPKILCAQCHEQK